MELLYHELVRKAFHIAGSYIPITYYFISKEYILILLFSINAILLLIEWQRLNGKIKFSELLMRPHEEKQVAAYLYFHLGALFSVLVFDKTIAIAAMLMLAVGDSASGLAGAMIKGGDIRNHNTKKIAIKPLPIMATMFAVCVLIGLILLNLPLSPDMIFISFHVYLAGAVGAALGDGINIKVEGKPVDDNLMIPLVAGLFMTAANII